MEPAERQSESRDGEEQLSSQIQPGLNALILELTHFLFGQASLSGVSIFSD